MTPLELNICVEVFSEDQKRKAEDNLQLEYMNAYWQRVENLKSFNEMINKKVEEKKMTNTEMLANVHKLNALFKGTVE